MYVVGFSLGAAYSLKFLGEEGKKKQKQRAEADADNANAVVTACASADVTACASADVTANANADVTDNANTDVTASANAGAASGGGGTSSNTATTADLLGSIKAAVCISPPWNMEIQPSIFYIWSHFIVVLLKSYIVKHKRLLAGTEVSISDVLHAKTLEDMDRLLIKSYGYADLQAYYLDVSPCHYSQGMGMGMGMGIVPVKRRATIVHALGYIHMHLVISTYSRLWI